MRGRKPTPTALKLVQGVENRRINDDEPQPDEGVPVCPSKNRRVREVWDYTMKQLQAMRTITMADRDNLHAYCQAVVLFEDATKILETEGLMSGAASSGRQMQHPATKIQASAMMNMRSLANEFGLTPAARTKIRVGDQTPDQKQGAQRLLSS